MYTGFYETDLDKIALCTESVKTAKIGLVEENGIGSDLNINIFGWKKNELVVIAQMTDTFKLSKAERLPLIIEASCIIRQGWGIDEFTLAAEGYCSIAPEKTQGKDLPSLYANNNSSVKECISFTHLQTDKHTFVTMPYSVQLGRKIEFHDVLWYNGGKVMRDIQFPAALKAALKIKTVEISEDDKLDRASYYGTLASAVMHCGFEIFYRDDI
jgi:hypothetical protein